MAIQQNQNELDTGNDEAGSLDILAEGAPAQPQNGQQSDQQDDVPDFNIVIDDGSEENAAAPNAVAQQQDQQSDDTDDQGEDQNDPNDRHPKLREPRWSKNRRRAEARDRDKRMLAEQNRRIQELERILQAQQESQNQFVARFEPKLNEITEASIRSQRVDLERRAADASRNFDALENQFYAAMEAGDYARMREIGRQRDKASADQIRLNYALENFDREVESRRAAAPRQEQAQPQQPQTRQPQQAAAIDPVATRLAQSFIASDAPWYGKAGSEDDTAVMDALERRVYEDGFDRTSPEFWDELADRASRALPHRFQDDTDTQTRKPAPARAAAPRQQAPAQPPLRRGPPTGAPGNTRSANAPVQFKLTPAHLEAARAANLIDENNRPIDKKKFFEVAQEWAANDRAMRAGQ